MRRVLTITTLAMWFGVSATPQCAMCREAAASQDGRQIEAFNAAILALGAPPALILAGIGWIAYRRRDG